METLDEVYFKMQGEQVWNSMEYGWGPSLILDFRGRSTGELKRKQDWDKANNEGSEVNAEALFSIFDGVCPNEFCRIANSPHAKETWDILQVTHEGTFTVKVSKLQILTTKFQNIRMHENKKFYSFYSELSDIVNFSFNLGEPILDSKVVRKILRSLLKRFKPKVIAIGKVRTLICWELMNLLVL